MSWPPRDPITAALYLSILFTIVVIFLALLGGRSGKIGRAIRRSGWLYSFLLFPSGLVVIYFLGHFLLTFSNPIRSEAGVVDYFLGLLVLPIGLLLDFLAVVLFIFQCVVAERPLHRRSR